MTPHPIPSRERFTGCLLGSALGDAIGEMAFRSPVQHELRERLLFADLLRYTDDTAMALGIAEAILDGEGRLDPEHLGDIFSRHFFEEPWRGYGPGPPSIFHSVEDEDVGYREVAGRMFDGEGSMGNGSAMRIAPLGVFYSGCEDAYEMAALSASVTHAHPLGRDGAGVLALAVGRAAGMDPDDDFSGPEFARWLAEQARSDEFRSAMNCTADLLEDGADREEAADTLGTDVLIHRSVPYAIFSFLKNPHSWEQCLMDAILVPGDRDTIGAMAAGISGAYLGEDALPDNWLDSLENREEIRDLAEKLHELRTRIARA